MPSPGLQSFVGSWYSVVAYGAGGAGNTNDTTAIQAAMTAANGNGGGTVVVPAGTYRLDSSLSWTGLTNVCLWLGTGASFTGVGTVTAASGTNNSIFDQRTSGGGGGGGTVTSVSGTSPISVATGTTTPAISFDGTAALSQSNTITGTAVGASGLTGAANPVRIVGRNASGTPASGTFAVGDVVINTDGTEYVCTVAGTPGTWVALNPGYGTPVNIDASVTSLSAGSLTTVARADHIHTLSNVPVLIASSTFSTNTANITYSNIPQTYRNLRIVISGLSTLSASYDSIQAQYNGVTTSSYYSSATVATGTFAYVGVLNAATSNWPTTCGTSDIKIAGYSDTSTKKLDVCDSWATITAGSSNYAQIPWFNVFDNTSAITSIKLFFNSGASFKSGTRISVFGEP